MPLPLGHIHGDWVLSGRKKGWSGWVRIRKESPFESDNDLVTLCADKIAWTKDVNGVAVPPATEA
jgi:hypothetical protein